MQQRLKRFVIGFLFLPSVALMMFGSGWLLYALIQHKRIALGIAGLLFFAASWFIGMVFSFE
jgi:hypothetical protein